MIGLILLIVICGFALWLINTYIPMQAPFKMILNALVVLVLVLFLLSAFGLIGGFDGNSIQLRR